MTFKTKLDFLLTCLAVCLAGATARAGSFCCTNYGEVTAYIGNPSGPFGQLGNNGGLNIGQTFVLVGTNMTVYGLGVYNYGGNGLNASHLVSMFETDSGSFVPVPGVSVTVPAGTNAALLNGYRYQSLAAPVTIGSGSFALVVFQMDGGTNSDGYSDPSGNNYFDGGSGLYNTGSIYQFTSDPGPNFPAAGGGASSTGVIFGCASFVYNLGLPEVKPVSAPAISPAFAYATTGQTVTLTASATGTLPISYQWYYGSSQAPIDGATNATLVLTDVQTNQNPGDAGIYSVAAANAAGGPVFSANPASATVHVVPTMSPLRIMPVGDSITDGFRGASGYRGTLYTTMVNAVYNINFVGTQSDNSVPWLPYPDHEGISGSVIQSDIAGMPIWLGEIPPPDIILLLIGTNDYGDDDDPNDATNRLDSLVEEIATDAPNAALFVANLLLRTDDAQINQEIETNFNPFVPVIVSNHFAMGQQVYFVDMHDALGASDLSDGLHPNQTGYDIMAAVWFQAITNIFKPIGPSNPFLSRTANYTAVDYIAAPGTNYVLERFTNFGCGNFVGVGTNVVPTNGLLQIIDQFSDLGGTAPSSAFYQYVAQ